MEQSPATIHLHRRVKPVQPLLVYTVDIDGRAAAELAVAQRRSVEVTPGRHRVQAKVLWMSSPDLEVEVDLGASVTIEIGPDMKHLWNMFARPKKFLRVDAA
jgi:hypothetical protein